MNRIRFYVGMEDKAGREVSGPRLWQVANAVTEFGDGGFTRFNAIGSWEMKREPSRVFEVIVDKDREAACEMAAKLAHIANQTCVLVTVEPIDAYFIPAAYSPDTMEVQV